MRLEKAHSNGDLTITISPEQTGRFVMGELTHITKSAEGQPLPDADVDKLTILAIMYVASQNPELLQPLPKFKSPDLRLLVREIESLADIPESITDVKLSPDQTYL